MIHGLDWLKARIQNLVYTPIAQQDKVPYTDAGIGVISPAKTNCSPLTTL